MEFKQLSSGLSVAAQIGAADVPAIKAAGFRSIVCHRPDGEAADQPHFRDVEHAAKTAGLEIRYQPIVPGKAGPSDATHFAAMLNELPSPTLAYCRTGTRSASLWSMIPNK